MIKVSPFGMRQVGVSIDSGKFGGYTGSKESLEQLVEKNFHKATKGNRPYVKVVCLGTADFMPFDFVTGFVKITPEIPVTVKMEVRREGEDPVPVRYARGKKEQALSVDVILYSKQALIEGGDEFDPDGDWQIVSLNCMADPLEDEEPQDPYTMLRNWFSSDKEDPRGKGGSPYPENYNPNTFIHELWKAMMYWWQYARIEEAAR